MKSFFMHFEKRQRGLLWEAFCSEGEGSSGCKRGGKGRLSVLKNEVNCCVHLVFQDRYFLFSPVLTAARPPLPHYGKLPALTHVDVFSNAWKMMSRWCLFARIDFTKKTLVYYWLDADLSPGLSKCNDYKADALTLTLRLTLLFHLK